jgi:hypothetical protein
MSLVEALIRAVKEETMVTTIKVAGDLKDLLNGPGLARQMWDTKVVKKCHTCGLVEPDTHNGMWYEKINDTPDQKDWWFCSKECYENRFVCQTCSGAGVVEDTSGKEYDIECPNCKGSGKIVI